MLLEHQVTKCPTKDSNKQQNQIRFLKIFVLQLIQSLLIT
jgi:hypothetical protein